MVKPKKLGASIDWRQTQEGHAIFASASDRSVVKLPFRVKPRVLVDETFAMRDLVYALNRVRPQRVFTLGHVTRPLRYTLRRLKKSAASRLHSSMAGAKS